MRWDPRRGDQRKNPKGSLMEYFKRDLFGALKTAGVDSNQFRDAVHEGIHAQWAEVPLGRWGDRNLIFERMQEKADSRLDLFREEAIARATEWFACDLVGELYEIEDYLPWISMEGYKSGANASPEIWGESIANFRASPVPMERLLELCEALSIEPPPTTLDTP